MQVLETLMLTQIDRNLNYKLDDVPSNFVSVDPFDMLRYPGEKLATPHFVTYLMAGLDASYDVHVM